MVRADREPCNAHVSGGGGSQHRKRPLVQAKPSASQGRTFTRGEWGSALFQPTVTLTPIVISLTCCIEPTCALSCLPPAQAWCLHESQKYAGVPILGSKANGGLTSYALSVMVLCLFTAFAAPEAGGERPTKMKTPFDVMLRFLQVRHMALYSSRSICVP